MKLYRITVITPSLNIERGVWADSLKVSDGQIIFRDEYNEVIAVYPSNYTLITSIETKAHCLLFLNSIYESWSGYKHYQTDKENIRKDKKVITTYKYGFKPSGDMADTKVYSMIAKAK